MEAGETVSDFQPSFWNSMNLLRSVLCSIQLSPEIIHLAIIGALLDHVSMATLRVSLPADWEEQKKFLGIE